MHVTVARFFDWLPLVALAWALGFSIGHALALCGRGVRVVVGDWQRTPAQMLCDTVLVLALLFLVYQVVANAWPLPARLVPPLLSTPVFDALAAKVVGALLVVAAAVIQSLALCAFGDSWRLGIDRERPGELVTGGIFAWTRNPIYLALDISALGVFLLQGRLILVVLAAIIVLTIHEEIGREERFLGEAYGEAYRVYRARVGRYVSWRLPDHADAA